MYMELETCVLMDGFPWQLVLLADESMNRWIVGGVGSSSPFRVLSDGQ